MLWRKKKQEPVKESSVDERPVFAEIWPTFDSDKCDKCPAPARVRVFIPHVAQVIDFCGHHFRKNHKKIDELGYIWVDGRTEREKFTKTLQDISGKL